MYRPRSRGLTMSAMTTWTSAVRPPAPMPWSDPEADELARRPGQPGERGADHEDDQRRAASSSLRSNRSANLPQTGVLTVIASRVEVTTHV